VTDHPVGPAGGEEEPPASGSSSLGPREGGPSTPSQRQPEGPEHEGIRFRDNRKIDPDTYEVREQPAVPAQPGAEGAQAGVLPEQAVDPLDERVAELTTDLQRLSAEYANYRKRVDRDRELQRDLTVGVVLNDLLPALDDVVRARDHGELEGGFKAVGESIEAVAAKYGLERFGAEGEPFDPNVHEAMTSEASPDVTEPTVGAVYQAGYRIRDRVLRPARVAVLDTE
jgi:molecular chaperone GrpE